MLEDWLDVGDRETREIHLLIGRQRRMCIRDRLKRDKEAGRLGTAVSSAATWKTKMAEATRRLQKEAEDEKEYEAKLASLLASEDYDGASSWANK